MWLSTIALTLFGLSITTCQNVVTYLITPDDLYRNSSCQNCLTFQQFSSNLDRYLRSNTSLIMQPGNFTLRLSLVISNVGYFALYHDSSSYNSLLCKEDANLQFRSVTSLWIQNLQTKGCIRNLIKNVNRFVLININFRGLAHAFDQSYNGSALVVSGSKGSMTHCQFSEYLFGTYNLSLGFKRNSFKNVSMERLTTWIGGAMIVTQSNVTIIQSNFTQNRAQLGGAIYAENKTIIIIKNVSFIFNTVAASLPACSDQNEVASGGAIYAVYGCSISIQNSYFENNQAYCGGNIFGGVIAMYQGSLFISESEFENSYRGRVAYLLECSISLKQSRLNFSHDGVLFALRSRITIEGSTIVNSRGSQGGVVCMINSSMVLKYSTFEQNFALSSTGGVIYAIEVCSISMVVCTFRSNSAWYGGVNYYDGTNLTIRIELCYFFYNYAHGEGGVFYFAEARETAANVSLSIKSSRFNGNHAGNKGGIIFSQSYSSLTISDDKNNFENNSALEGAIIYVVSDSSIIKSSNSYIHYNRANKQGIVFLTGTRAIYLGVEFLFNNGTALMAIEADITFEQKVEFFGNKAHRSLAHFTGGAISLIRSVIRFKANCKLSYNEAQIFGGAIASLNSHIHILDNVHISNNRAVIGGGLYLYQSELFCKNVININENFANSSGGGTYSSMSFIRLSGKGSLVYVRNHAQFGGGVFLTKSSKFNIEGIPGQQAHYSSRILLLYNIASKGGAIYIDDDADSFSCRSQSLGEYLEDECFIQAALPFGHDALIQFLLFKKNEATHGGSDIYGGLIDRCRPSPLSSDKPLIDFLVHFSNIQKTSISVSSRPVRICFCKNNQQNCSYQPDPVYVMKGEDFILPLVAVDQVNNSINATVYAYTLSRNSGLGVGQRSQYALQSCTNMTYRIYSEYPSENLNVYPEGPCRNANRSSRFVNVQFSRCKCPIGFMVSPDSPSECKCICHELVAPYLQECNHSSMSLVRNTPVWMDYVCRNTSYGTIEGYIILPHCPYDYCVSPSIPVYINLNEENGSDAQCAFSHSGLLCGACKLGFSLALGTSKCFKCSNIWLILLIPFCLAGIVLVISILMLDLTVSKGSINAMIFFSNIIVANRPVFIPLATRYNFLAMFVSWFSLDLGIETCFAAELDQYKKAWLQFVFPIYIFILVILIIISAQCSQKLSKLLGECNPVATLATLIWLSNAKLFRTILSAVSFTTLKYPDNTTTIVWLPDGNINFLMGKHIPLFLMAVATLAVAIVYITVLFLWQWLICIPKCKITSWITNVRLISLMDTYHAPYKSKHRYWPGMLVLTCMIQYSVTALNTRGDPMINLFAIIVLIATLIVYKGSVSGVYKKWPLDILETSIHFNLILFSAATMYATYTSGNQALLADISLSIYFITFLIVIIYHVLLSIFCKKLYEKFNLRRSLGRHYYRHFDTSLNFNMFRDADSLQLFDSDNQGTDGISKDCTANYNKMSDKTATPSNVTHSEIEI